MVASLRKSLVRIDFERANLKSFKNLPVMSHGFFPGGNGLYRGIPATHFPVGGTLILGSNFDLYSNFVDAEGALVIQDERSKTTWSRLLILLRDSGIDRHQSFFTNAWPCLHEGESAVVTKLIPLWLKDDQLMLECTEFFRFTYAAMQPRLIVALGPGPAAFLGSVWPSSLGVWRANTITGLNLLPIGMVQHARQGYDTVCTAITHPSGEHYNNARHRKPPYQNREGEVRLLKDAHEVSQKIMDGSGMNPFF
jgi:hypothetical protein